ncbi:MAG: hypothetical protein GQ542_09895 [Desulforhopalus sp.]|nr:hypothetical protein [Desulforhopalus sp.]
MISLVKEIIHFFWREILFSGGSAKRVTINIDNTTAMTDAIEQGIMATVA